MSRWLLAWGVIAAALGAGEGQYDAGRLCVDSECRDVRCGESVAPALRQRAFTFTTADTCYLGLLPADSSAISCGGDGVLELKISVARPPRRAAARLLVADSHDNRWEIPVKEQQFRKPLRVRLPAGPYVIVAESAHHQRLTRKVAVSHDLSRITFDLQPLPVLSGSVFDGGTRSPLIGAKARTDSGDTAITDGTGRFVLETNPETWPKTITLSAGGYADSTVPLPPAHVSRSLDDVYLGRGGTITVELKRQDATPGAQVDLQKLKRGKLFADAAIKSLPVRAGEQSASLEFVNLEPGDYVVMAKGLAQCERHGERVSVLEGETKHVTMEIAPFTLHVRAQMAGQPLAGATISFRSDAGHWQEKFTADAAGEASVRLWQGGDTVLTASLTGMMTMPYRERRDLVDGEDVDWLLSVPGRAVEGVVVDSVTGEPIPKAYIALHMNRSSDGTADSVKAHTDDTGHFRFAPVDYGPHRLIAVAGKYLPAEVKFQFSEPQELENITVRLDPASLVHVKVVDARNGPIAGAQLIEYRGGALIGYGLTDDAGIAQMPAAEGESYDVYVIPRDGSFGFLRVTSEAPETSLRIADGSSQIVLRCQSESHEPIPGIWVAVRYNGQPLPIAVMDAVANAQGIRLMTGQDGQIRIDRMPPGLYEFWPAGSTAELRAMLSAGGNAPAKIAINAGENVALMTFARAGKN